MWPNPSKSLDQASNKVPLFVRKFLLKVWTSRQGLPTSTRYRPKWARLHTSTFKTHCVVYVTLLSCYVTLISKPYLIYSDFLSLVLLVHIWSSKPCDVILWLDLHMNSIYELVSNSYSTLNERGLPLEPRSLINKKGGLSFLSHCLSSCTSFIHALK